MEEMTKKIKEELLAMQDKTYQEFHSNLCPGVDNIIGIRVPILRDYAKKLAKNYPIKELIEKIDNQYYEEIMLQGMLIGCNKEKEILPMIQDFVPKIDNWAVNDVFCAGLKVTKKYKEEMWEFLKPYLASDKEFLIRFAVVMILDYYIEEAYLKEDFEIFNSITHKGYYVQMAVAWAVSLCLIRFYEETIQYLASKDCKLDTFTFNKSLQKAIESFRILPEQKEELRKMKK